MDNKPGFDNLNRPNWDLYFMTLAFVVAQRSIDPSTKHGAILVSKNNKILSTGYNGPIRGVDDSKIPLTRPEKYWTMTHSEDGCLASYTGSASDLEGARIYVTGRPCHRCLRTILQKGIKHIIYGRVPSMCIDEEDIKAQTLILDLVKDVKIEEYEDSGFIMDILEETRDYIMSKCFY
jgi:dCMP deaminase